MFGAHISQLDHFEVTTPDLAASVAFYRDVLGMEVSAQKPGSVWLRGWGESFHHALQLTAGDAPGVAHIGWRAISEATLNAAAAMLEETEWGCGWVPAIEGYGRAFRYVSPGGHSHEIFWEVDRFPPAGQEPFIPNCPQRFVPRGCAVRMIDHITIASKDMMADVAWYRDVMGHRFMEYTMGPEQAGMGDTVVFAMTTTCQRGHDLGIVLDGAGGAGRTNHIALFHDGREELRRAAEVLLDQGTPIEFGPGKHGMGEQDYLYVREPGGMRVELNASGYQNYEPDWQPVRWTPAQGSNVAFKNLGLPHSMLDSFPPIRSAMPQARQRDLTGLCV